MTKKNNYYVLCLLIVNVCLIGCAADKELANAQLELDECRLELKALREQVDPWGGDSNVRARLDRLAAENAHLRRQLAQIEDREKQLRKTLSIEKQEKPENRQRIAALQSELKQALGNIRSSRVQWENTLADRQRQIDMLNNKTQRLEKELQAVRGEKTGLR